MSCGRLATVVLSGVSLWAGVGLRGQEERAARPEAEITSKLRLGVSRGLNFLVAEQQRTNSFHQDDFPVAANALAGLAFLAAGYTDQVGPAPYVAALRDCTSTLLAYQKESGYFDDDGRSRMYGHGFATLFLAELYGMSARRDQKIRESLRQAVTLIERSQRPGGGWDYLPYATPGVPAKVDQESSDTSITVCQTMALRAARNLGLTIDPTVVQRAQSYIRRAQNADGGFRYRSGSSLLNGSSKFPRSAAGVCILYSLAGPGDYSSSEIRRGIEYLEKNYKKLEPHFPFYAQYYCSQAMFQIGGHHWRDYFPWIRSRLLAYQRQDGSWRPGKIETSSVQRSAMALIILQLPFRFLPIHER